MALIVLGRTEDALAEQAVALWLIGAIVDGLGLENFTVGVLEDFLGRGKTNRYLGEISLCLGFFLKSHLFEMFFYKLVSPG